MSNNKNKYGRSKKFKISVVGEGATEWHYISSFNKVENYKVSIRPSLPKKSTYSEIFNKAKQLINQGYDRAYCLIDLDVCCEDMVSYQKYLKEKKSIEKNKNIKVFETMPCIEYWFLLHFTSYSSKKYSSCDEVVKDLRK